MNDWTTELPWTEEQWHCIQKTVTEEAQRARVAARFLSIYGPVDEKDIAVANLALQQGGVTPVPAPGVASQRLTVNSTPGTALATLSVLVYVRNNEAADPELQAATTMFRRAANLIARTEDAMMFNGQRGAGQPPIGAPGGPIQVSGGRRQFGLIGNGILGIPGYVGALGPFVTPPVSQSRLTSLPSAVGFALAGRDLISVVVDAINRLEAQGYSGPYACALGNNLWEAIHIPTSNLVLPRYTIEPLMDGGMLVRSSTIHPDRGVIVAYESGQVEQVLGRDIRVRLLQISAEPRFVFRVSERIALRVKHWPAVVNLLPANW